MKTVIGEQGRYVKIGKDNQNVLGTIRVETTRWEVNGPFKAHQFRYIKIAETLCWGLKISDVIEHWIAGKMVNAFGWGHGVTEAYIDSQSWATSHREGDYDTKLIANNIFKHDLPCCGGEFVCKKEIVDYFTLEHGDCDKCGQQWDITDGHHFSHPICILADGTAI